MKEHFAPQFVMQDGSVQTPTHVEWLLVFAIKGFQWAIDALPEAIRLSELEACETFNGGCI